MKKPVCIKMKRHFLSYINIVTHVANCNNVADCLSVLNSCSAREMIFIALWLTLNLQQKPEVGY